MKVVSTLLAGILVVASGLANAEQAVQQQYKTSCYGCHEHGAAGAPKSGDVDAWRERIDKGLSGLVASTKQGVGRMPPMGMCSKCTDEDFEALIKFMLTKKREAL